VNGDFLLAHGHGIQELDPRELCDLSYALIVRDMEQSFYAVVSSGNAKFEESDPLGEQIALFEEKIGLREDPAAIALELHKRLLAAQGKEWDDTPVGAGSGQWWDQDVEFTDMADLDAPQRKRESMDRTRRLFPKKDVL
jgi:hypothetical protein